MVKIVAIEGIDASGKETQTRMLFDKLRRLGYNVQTESFPRYNTKIGKLIKACLEGRIKLTDEAFHMLLEADRLDFKEVIEFNSSVGTDYLILDRYTLSNLAFGMARGLDLDWLIQLQSPLPKADITFVLDISTETSLKRKNRSERDVHELDLSLLNRAKAAYVFLANKLSKEELIYVIDANHASPESIHDVIVSHLALLQD